MKYLSSLVVAESLEIITELVHLLLEVVVDLHAHPKTRLCFQYDTLRVQSITMYVKRSDI
jgi:hypothetical protein